MIVLVGPLALPALLACHARRLFEQLGEPAHASLARAVSRVGWALIALHLAAITVLGFAAISVGGVSRLSMMLPGRSLVGAYVGCAAVLNFLNAILMFAFARAAARPVRTHSAGASGKAAP